MVDKVPAHVREKLQQVIETVDDDEDGYISYLEFLDVITEMKSEIQAPSDQDIQTCKPPPELGLDAERKLMSTQYVMEWIARIYLKQCELTIDSKPLLNRLDTSSFDNTSDQDLESHVSAWNLDDIVNQVFNDKILDSIESYVDSPVGNSSDDDEIFDKTTIQKSNKERRKKDIIMSAIKTITAKTNVESPDVSLSRDKPVKITSPRSRVIDAILGMLGVNSNASTSDIDTLSIDIRRQKKLALKDRDFKDTSKY